MQALIFLFSFIGGIAVLIGMLIGPNGNKHARERLENWYVLVGDGDWSKLLSSSARATDRLMAAALGEPLISARGIATWMALCLAAGIATELWVLYRDFHSLYVVTEPSVVRTVAEVILQAFLVGFADYFVIALSRLMLRLVAISQHLQFVTLFLIYSAVTIYIMRLFFVAVRHTIWSFPLLDQRPLSWSWMLTNAFRPETGEEQIWPLTIAVFSSPSTVIFLAVVIGATLLVITRYFTKPLALWTLERLASSKGGFAGVGAAFLAISSVLVSIQREISKSP